MTSIIKLENYLERLENKLKLAIQELEKNIKEYIDLATNRLIIEQEKYNKKILSYFKEVLPKDKGKLEEDPQFKIIQR